MVEQLPETRLLWAIAAHPRWALFAAILYVCCAFVLWRCETPQWVIALLLVSLVLVFTVVGLAAACDSGAIVIG
jgi:hypothetical protein